MTMTFGSQIVPALVVLGAPLLALAPAAAAGFAAVPAARALSVAPLRRRALAALALAAGLFLALGALTIGPLPERTGLDQLFVPMGWWDIDAVALLTERVPDAMRALPALIVTPFAALPTEAQVAAVGFLLAVTLMLAMALAEPRPVDGFGAVGVGIVLIVASATLGVYAACTVLWLAAYLNYWTFAVLLFALQRWRHGAI